jgi:glycine cleavage system H protein
MAREDVLPALNKGVNNHKPPTGQLTRREFLQSAGLAVGGATILSVLPACGPSNTTTPTSSATPTSPVASSLPIPPTSTIMPASNTTTAVTPTAISVPTHPTTPVAITTVSTTMTSTIIPSTALVTTSPAPSTSSSPLPSNTPSIPNTPAVSRTISGLQVPADLLYTSEGMWIKAEANDQVRIGITYHLYNIMVYTIINEGGVEISAKVRLLPVGTKLKRMDIFGPTFGTMETSKMMVDLYTPVSGTIVDTNMYYANDTIYPQQNTFDMYGDGWMIVMKIDDPSELKQLMSAKEYESTYKQL